LKAKPGRGVFLVLDGLDRAGKSTQLELLADWLEKRGLPFKRCRDPGGTKAGDAIRNLLLDVRSTLGMPCEALLYLASRAQLVSEIVRPALEEGRIVLCDRYELATFAYQGHAGGIDLAALRAAARLATGGLAPDWTGVLDIDPETAASRRVGPADRIEARSSDFHRKVRDGFLAEARLAPDRITVIDAARDPSQVHSDIAKEVERVLAAAGRA
jgi:dTMP kinase